MKRKWIIPLVAGAAAALVAYGIARHAVCGRSAPDIDRLQDLSFLSRELGLNGAQADAIKSLHVELSAKLNDCCALHCAARARLGQALACETNGTAQTDGVLAEMCRAYEQSERATLDHIRQLRTVLNPEQRKRFDVKISKCMCRSCDSKAANCR